ncbi:hypothetical protein HXX76_009308 [Chlamydomonas incerta]|uniref:MYND-type domain-containing protein n=1 Tax=Chlamydomonas incerta TaxID=51695 RepID=A0A835SRG7_CHLIN|nr:hypothetical protein HXX76_009308 [Chlamydomonas incerta]|eukprot:KAG2431813.1 hypothetical protein HXX76_009308 [Chlamydomonas incerta]
MSELNYTGSNGGRGAKGKAAVDYAGQQAPYQRNRRDAEQWARVAADNAVMGRKLDDIRREPPAGFHAPAGYKSVAGGQQAREQRAGKPQSAMPETLHYVPPTPWPPTEPAHEPARRSKAQREVDVANGRVAGKLREIYKHTPDSFLEKSKLGHGFDCNGRWALRTALYEAGQPGTAGSGGGAAGAARAAAAVAGGDGAAAARSTWGAAAGGNTLDMEQASVPKSLGVATCGGCAAKCFYAADGPRLFRCRACKTAWYCSEACAKLDYTSHKALCKYVTTGHWAPGGMRPAGECWVNNAAMAVVRRDLQHRREAGTAAVAGGSGSSAPGTPRAAAGGGGGCSGRGSPAVGAAAGGGAGGRPGTAGVAASSSPTKRMSLVGGATGVPEMDEQALGGEVDVQFELQAKYQALRRRELAAEAELADVARRAAQGLDGPRPCMFTMQRFAGEGPKKGGGGGTPRRPASAGGSYKVDKRPVWKDTANFM